MKIGYARVSTDPQELGVQLDKLKAAGCDKIFEEKESGANDSRPVFKEVLEFLRKGDTLVVADTTRWGRNPGYFWNTFSDIVEKGIGYQSIDEPFLSLAPGEQEDPTQELLRGLVVIVGNFNRKISNNKVKEGKARAMRERGHAGGRPKHDILSNTKSLSMIQDTYDSKKHTIKQIMDMYNLKSKTTFYRYIKKDGTPSDTAPTT